MGREQRRIEVHAYLSRHNSDQDRKDDADWEELRNRIEAICREHRYADLNVQVM